MSPFYTPIFERGWVKEMWEKIVKDKKDKEIRYEKIDVDEEYEE